MIRIAVIGLGIWLADAEDRQAAVDAWYEGRQLPKVPEGERAEALQGAAARALHDAGVRSRSAFEWIHVGEDRDEGTVDVDRWVGTIWEALTEAGDAFAEGRVDSVLIIEVGASGGGAIVLKPQRITHGPRYAVIDGLGRWSAGATADVTSGCRQGLAEAGVEPTAVGYLDVLVEDLDWPNRPVAAGLLGAYQVDEEEPSPDCALGMTSRQDGAVFALIKAVSALNRGFIPAWSDRSELRAPNRWLDTPFYAVARAKPWFAGDRPRVAVLHDGSPAPARQGGHLVLSESEYAVAADAAIARSDYVLIPLGAASREGFEARLAALEAEVDAAGSPDDLRDVARRAYEGYRDQSDVPYVMALVGEGREGVAREIAYAREGLSKVFERGEVWRSPRGSTLTTRPLGLRGRVAFVYPGAFNAYLDLGRDLFHLFPFLYESFGHVVSDMGRSVRDRALYPRSLTPLTKKERQAREAALLADPPALIESGTSSAVLFTTILREGFGVHPHTALGYSLGEVSMLWALGVWQDGDRGLRAWRSSPLFKSQLSGPKTLIRERWDRPEDVDDEDLWATYVLKAPVAQARSAVAGRPRVEVTLVNTPGEVVIGGDPGSCREVIEALDVHALPVPYDAVIHASLMSSLRPDFAALYDYPVRAVPETTFYSAADYGTLTLESGALARSLARMTCAPVDFTRLVDRVYEDGARIFVEVGPQRTCTRWIDKILGERPHAAMAIDRKNAPDALSILGVLAGLVSHQMPVDLSLLYQEPAVSTPALPEVEQHDAVQESNIRQRVPVPAPVSSAAAALRETTGHLAHDHMLRDAAIHRAFLGARQTGMADLSGLIRTQMDAYGALLGHIPAGRRVQFDEDAVRAFAQGSPMRCFGALFEPFKGRRVPRIPNGSFRFLDRVPVVDGPKGIVEVGRTLTGECGVSTDAWFLLPDGIAPHAILMEMGMQPCGFLSAYMGSTRRHPDTDFYFRNLDGEAVLLKPIDLRGRTVTSRVTLRASTAVGNAIVQTFGFTLACGGEDFYTGEATFGYFTRATLNARAGLDGGEEITPWLRRSSGINGWTPPLSYEQMPARLSFLRDVRVVDDGGTYRNGYAHAFLDVPPDAWFFARHFYEDPVMPGSLGVEAMQSALGTCAYAQIEPSGTVLPRLTTPRDVQTRWRYRGQIVPDDLRDEVPLHLEVHVIEREVDSARVWARGEGSLWKGKLRIYEVDDLAVELPLH